MIRYISTGGERLAYAPRDTSEIPFVYLGGLGAHQGRRKKQKPFPAGIGPTSSTPAYVPPGMPIASGPAGGTGRRPPYGRTPRPTGRKPGWGLPPVSPGGMVTGSSVDVSTMSGMGRWPIVHFGPQSLALAMINRKLEKSAPMVRLSGVGAADTASVGAGAAQGAAAGTAVAPGYGTAIGAVVGAAAAYYGSSQAAAGGGSASHGRFSVGGHRAVMEALIAARQYDAADAETTAWAQSGQGPTGHKLGDGYPGMSSWVAHHGHQTVFGPVNVQLPNGESIVVGMQPPGGDAAQAGLFGDTQTMLVVGAVAAVVVGAIWYSKKRKTRGVPSPRSRYA